MSIELADTKTRVYAKYVTSPEHIELNVAEMHSDGSVNNIQRTYMTVVDKPSRRFLRRAHKTGVAVTFGIKFPNNSGRVLFDAYVYGLDVQQDISGVKTCEAEIVIINTVETFE